MGHFVYVLASLLTLGETSFGSELLPPPAVRIDVPAGDTVTWSGNVSVGNFAVAGTLQIKDGARIKVRTLRIETGGKLIIGTDADPVADVEIAFTGKVDPVTDPLAWQVGLLVQGDMTTRAKTVNGSMWGIPDERQYHIKRRGGIQFKKEHRVVSQRPEGTAYQLNRAIRIIGGHTIFLRGSMADVQGIEWSKGGRSTTGKPDNSKVVDGKVVHLGQNQQARYTAHVHHGGDRMHRFVDCVARDSVGRWGFVSHGTSNVTFDRCLTWNVLGCGFYREDTIGRNIEWKDCKAIASRRLDIKKRQRQRGGVQRVRMLNRERFVVGGRMGDGFWTDHAFGITITGCEARGCAFAGFQVNGYYRGDVRPVSESVFDDNLAVGCEIGYWQNHAQGTVKELRREINRFKAVNCIYGIWSYHASNLTFRDLTLKADPQVTGRNDYTTPEKLKIGRLTNGIYHGNSSYRNSGMRFLGVTTITGYHVAVNPSMAAQTNGTGNEGWPNGQYFEDLRSGCHIGFFLRPSRVNEENPEGRHVVKKFTRIAEGAPTDDFPVVADVFVTHSGAQQGKHSGDNVVTIEGKEHRAKGWK